MLRAALRPIARIVAMTVESDTVYPLAKLKVEFRKLKKLGTRYSPYMPREPEANDWLRSLEQIIAIVEQRLKTKH
jgi:hypothetical protein